MEKRIIQDRASALADVAEMYYLEDKKQAEIAKTVGVTPIEYVLQLRMALAKDMLRREKRSLAQVAEAVGYQSTSAFSTAFSRYHGISPGAFARNKT